MALDDLETVDDAALRARVLDAAGRLALLLLKHARTDADIAERLVSWADLVRDVAGAPGGMAAAGLLLPFVLVNHSLRHQTPLLALQALTMGAAVEAWLARRRAAQFQ